MQYKPAKCHSLIIILYYLLASYPYQDKYVSEMNM